MNENRLRISEAIGLYNSKSQAKKMRQSDLGKEVLPDTNSADFYISRWNRGYSMMTLTASHIKRLCKFLEVDANFLYGVSPMPYKKIDPAIVSNSIDPLTIRTMCKSFGVDANALFNVKPMK